VTGRDRGPFVIAAWHRLSRAPPGRRTSSFGAV